jgi:hypothetical protein
VKRERQDHRAQRPRLGLSARLTRTLVFTLFTFPYAIIAIPLTIYLLGHLLVGIPSLVSHALHGDFAHVLSCLPCVVTIITFVTLTALFTVLKLMEGWRGEDQNEKPRT